MSVIAATASLRSQKGTVGTVTLVGRSARAGDDTNQRFLDTLTIVEPGTLTPLRSDCGE